MYYDFMLSLSLESLNRTGCTLPRIALVTPDIYDSTRRILSAYSVDMVTVSPIESPQAPHYWKDQFTKLLIWNMTQYRRVMYYDSDTVFMSSPAPALEACGNNHFCAVQDSGIGHAFFNTGFMVLRPSRRVLSNFYQNPRWATGNGEQDFLNIAFHNMWTPLENKYNHLLQGPDFTAEVMAATVVHAKIWDIQKKIPSPANLSKPWIWEEMCRNLIAPRGDCSPCDKGACLETRLLDTAL
jgi:alpha-N-acetylglucosamine transferase